MKVKDIIKLCLYNKIEIRKIEGFNLLTTSEKKDFINYSNYEVKRINAFGYNKIALYIDIE